MAVNVDVRSPNPRMNAISHRETDALALVEIIDLKWLLAGEGLHLHVERLQKDPVYARGILGAAAESRNHALCAVAERVRKLLHLDEA
jgi:hypothetical protein